MPFAMTHLNIAYNIIKTTPQIENPSEFMLGSIAPDSVHFRNEYSSDMKFNSHLCVGNQKWGQVTNNDEWIENVLLFLEENKTSKNKDFIYGYCSHILADIQNNIKIWTPFRESIKDNLDENIGSRYHEESAIIDFELYLHSKQKEIWEMLEISAGSDVLDIITEKEVESMKQSLLKEKFSNRKSVDTSKNKYVTLLNIEKFIIDESEYIKNILYGKS